MSDDSDRADAPDGSGETGADARSAVRDAHRREWAFVLAATARVAGDLDLAEECVQDAYLSALDAWERQGVPNSPGAWLTTAARRRALDARRRERTLRDKLPLIAPRDETAEGAGFTDPAAFADEDIPDDRLRLVFTCCHPALGIEAQIALTLRLVCGLTTRQIADAFLVSEATMAARVTRAKKKIAAARIPYRVPEAAELPDRLGPVLSVVHLLYTTAHTDSSGTGSSGTGGLTRADLAERAIDLARMLTKLMPDEAEVRGILALLLLTDARRETRVDENGQLLLLADQDRERWDRAAIAEGTALVTESLRSDRPGRYAIQAAIAALHNEAESYDETDWPQIVQLYDVLLHVWQSPVVELNRVAALSMAEGPEKALAELATLEHDSRLTDYRYLPATKADLLRRLGRFGEAEAAYQDALALTCAAAERGFLERRIAEVNAAIPSQDR